MSMSEQDRRRQEYFKGLVNALPYSEYHKESVVLEETEGSANQKIKTTYYPKTQIIQRVELLPLIRRVNFESLGKGSTYLYNYVDFLTSSGDHTAITADSDSISIGSLNYGLIPRREYLYRADMELSETMVRDPHSIRTKFDPDDVKPRRWWQKLPILHKRLDEIISDGISFYDFDERESFIKEQGFRLALAAQDATVVTGISELTRSAMSEFEGAITKTYYQGLIADLAKKQINVADMIGADILKRIQTGRAIKDISVHEVLSQVIIDALDSVLRSNLQFGFKADRMVELYAFSPTGFRWVSSVVSLDSRSSGIASFGHEIEVTDGILRVNRNGDIVRAVYQGQDKHLVERTFPLVIPAISLAAILNSPDADIQKIKELVIFEKGMVRSLVDMPPFNIALNLEEELARIEQESKEKEAAEEVKRRETLVAAMQEGYMLQDAELDKGDTRDPQEKLASEKMVTVNPLDPKTEIVKSVEATYIIQTSESAQSEDGKIRLAKRISRINDSPSLDEIVSNQSCIFIEDNHMLTISERETEADILGLLQVSVVKKGEKPVPPAYLIYGINDSSEAYIRVNYLATSSSIDDVYLQANPPFGEAIRGNASDITKQLLKQIQETHRARQIEDVMQRGALRTAGKPLVLIAELIRIINSPRNELLRIYDLSSGGFEWQSIIKYADRVQEILGELRYQFPQDQPLLENLGFFLTDFRISKGDGLYGIPLRVGGNIFTIDSTDGKVGVRCRGENAELLWESSFPLELVDKYSLFETREMLRDLQGDLNTVRSRIPITFQKDNK